jgi:hypothetical protein
MDEAFDAVTNLAQLTTRRFETPGGARGRPFRVLSSSPDGLQVRTSTGGRLRLRAEVFATAEKLLADLGATEEDRWVFLKDEVLSGVLRGENRDKAVSSYVFPLLEAAGRVEIERKRPARLRLIEGVSDEA